jgi:RNA polymerase sigma factor for flagellar operon FliA
MQEDNMQGQLPETPSKANLIQKRNELLMEFYPMVRQVAYRMARKYPRCVDADDLVQIGMTGLIDAVDRFEHDRAPSFAAYARIRVQGAIVDEMRKNDWVPRSVRDRAARIDRARAELNEQLGRVPTNLELATFLGVDEMRLEELLKTADVRVLVSTEEGDEDEATVGESLRDESVDLGAVLEGRNMNDNIRVMLQDLPERERLIVDLYYYQDYTFREIADVLGVTESRVSQLHTRMKKRIQERIGDIVDERPAPYAR